MPDIPDNDRTDELRAAVREALADGAPVAVTGGGTKAFYGNPVSARPLAVSGHSGIVHHAPTELVVTVRAGTSLAALEARLAEAGQELGCEPPHFGEAATVGGMVAAGLSGPPRPWSGAVRDAVLGAKILSGTGEVLSFGGEVMKNVAGYDVSRVMTGSLGTLGLLLEVSLKVVPRPAAEATRTFAMDEAAALRALADWGRHPLPFAGTCHQDGRLHVRLAGNAGAVAEAAERLGGEAGHAGEGFWADLREQRLPFFRGEGAVWRISVPPAAPPLGLPGETLTEWGGALRWLCTPAPAETIRAAATAAGGHAVLFRGGDPGEPAFPPLPRPLMTLHRNLKRAMDPHGLFNPGRLYPEL